MVYKIATSTFDKRFGKVEIKYPPTKGKSHYTGSNYVSCLATLLQHYGCKRVLELGVCDGRTAKALLEHCPTIERYVGVDVLPSTKLNRQQKEQPTKPGHLVLDKRFECFAFKNGSFDYFPQEQFDFVYIDGDHSRAAVLHDTKLARRVCKNGVICWHDYNNENTEVKQALDSIDGAIINIDKTWFAYEIRGRKAVVVLGPESSGTKMLTECFVSSGYHGEAGDNQRLDNWNFSNLPDKIVYRQSVPHGKHWLRFNQFAPLLESQGFEILTKIILRDWVFTGKSQVRRGHTRNYATAISKIRKAQRQIFEQVPNPEFVFYEPFVSNEQYRNRLFSNWGVQPKVDLFNANSIYR